MAVSLYVSWMPVRHLTTLFKQLGARSIPGYILRILSYWYKNQDMCIRWGDAYSAKFKVTNGVRQGGILSPYLFNVYVDELSEELNKCNVGCNLNGLLINHIMYADDLVLISPSSADCLNYCANVRNLELGMMSNIMRRRVLL